MLTTSKVGLVYRTDSIQKLNADNKSGLKTSQPLKQDRSVHKINLKDIFGFPNIIEISHLDRVLRLPLTGSCDIVISPKLCKGTNDADRQASEDVLERKVVVKKAGYCVTRMLPHVYQSKQIHQKFFWNKYRKKISK